MRGGTGGGCWSGGANGGWGFGWRRQRLCNGQCWSGWCGAPGVGGKVVDSGVGMRGNGWSEPWWRGFTAPGVGDKVVGGGIWVRGNGWSKTWWRGFTARLGDASRVGSGGDIIERRWFEVGLRLVIDIFIAGHARVVVDRLHF